MFAKPVTRARHKKPLVVEANSIVDEKFEFLKLNGAGRKEVVVSMWMWMWVWVWVFDGQCMIWCCRGIKKEE